jgi:hypothetical protein
LELETDGRVLLEGEDALHQRPHLLLLWRLAFKVQGAGCRVQGAGCRVQGAGCRVQIAPSATASPPTLPIRVYSVCPSTRLAWSIHSTRLVHLFDSVGPAMRPMGTGFCLMASNTVQLRRNFRRGMCSEMATAPIASLLRLVFDVEGSGYRVWGLGFRVQGAGCRVQGAGCRVQGAGLRAENFGLRVEG